MHLIKAISQGFVGRLLSVFMCFDKIALCRYKSQQSKLFGQVQECDPLNFSLPRTNVNRLFTQSFVIAPQAEHAVYYCPFYYSIYFLKKIFRYFVGLHPLKITFEASYTGIHFRNQTYDHMLLVQNTMFYQ